MKNNYGVALALSLAGAFSCGPSIDRTDVSVLSESQIVAPDFKQYKAFRTYVKIDKYTPVKDVFWLDFMARYSVTTTIAADTLQEVPNAPQFVTPAIRAGDPVPGIEIPADKLAVAEALKQKIFASHHNIDLNSVRMRYLGRFHHIDVSETVPFETYSSTHPVSLHQQRHYFRVSEDLRSLVRRSPSYRGVSNFCHQSQTDCVEQPLLIDFVMPERIEGTLPIAAHFEHASTNAAYVTAFENLQQQIFNTVSSLYVGNYSSPLAHILERQGDSLLPSHAVQELVTSVTGTRYFRGTGVSVSSTKIVQFKTEELESGVFAKEISLGETGFETRVTVDLPRHLIRLDGTFQGGFAKSKVFSVQGTARRDGVRIYRETSYFYHDSFPDPNSLSLDFSDIGPNEISRISIQGALSPSQVYLLDD